MTHTIFTHSVFGKINAIKTSEEKWYFCMGDMALALGGRPYAVGTVSYKITNNSPNRKEMPVKSWGGWRNKIFIPKEDMSRIWTYKDNESETELKEWLIACVAENPGMKADKPDIIQNPDVGIQLLTELKAERELRKKAEDENEINKYKANFADRIFQLITEMAEEITVS